MMRPSEVAQAIEYKRGDNNLILWALGQGYNITLWDENNERIIKNSHDYPKICKAMRDSYKLEINIVDPTEKKTKGWALAYTSNPDDEIISDYSANKFMDKWASQFEKFHEELNEILNNNYWEEYENNKI